MVGKELKELLLKEEIKIVDFSKIVGINQKTLSNYINGVSSPDVKTMRLIKNKYREKTGKNINLDWLITGEGEMFIKDKPNDEEIKADFDKLLQESGFVVDEKGYLRRK